MEKRKVIFGTYDTDVMGRFTLTGLQLSDPEVQSYYVEVKGRDGPLDFTTALTDGEPKYGGRTLTVTLETSEGTREERRQRISRMVNELDGFRMRIQLPDYPEHYLMGRVQVKEEYNDLAHAGVTVTATCETWLYAIEERLYTLTAGTNKRTAVLANEGRRKVVPQVVISGESASFLIESGQLSMALGPGTYQLPDLLLGTGNKQITYSGTGTAKITYREAVLR